MICLGPERDLVFAGLAELVELAWLAAGLIGVVGLAAGLAGPAWLSAGLAGPAWLAAGLVGVVGLAGWACLIDPCLVGLAGQAGPAGLADLAGQARPAGFGSKGITTPVRISLLPGFGGVQGD